ncbi:hypothetical protein WJX84_012254 [Apatococcus fuscideae]|uniref:Pyruvate kinase n=1 Tax=Apatococcus fuscideae TaxID=2026836 RepID=A0AAW1T2M6_9CHLO
MYLRSACSDERTPVASRQTVKDNCVVGTFGTINWLGLTCFQRTVNMELGGFLGNAGQLQASLKKGQKYAAPQQRQPIQPPAQRRSRRHPAQALPAEPLRSRSASPARPVVIADALAGYSKGVSLLNERPKKDGRSGLDLARDVPTDGSQFRKTKIVCTIGPTSNTREGLWRLADEGMNVARLNMSHGDHASHKAVVDLIREYNKLNEHSVAIMLDTKGPEVRSGDLTEPIDMVTGQKYIFTIQEGADGTEGRISVNYDGFIDDCAAGDQLLVDGGILALRIVNKTDRDVECEVIDGGIMKSRRHLNIRGKSANLPAITDKDWADIKFGVDVGVDYYALSFVRNADIIYELKRYLSKQGAKIGVLAKIESADSVSNLEDVLDAVDGAMVARGDLGAELPVEQVPLWQNKIVAGCRKRGKPVIVATNMLESMVTNPTPTRAEVSDIAIAVREGSDAVMLSGETAYGSFPFKSVNVMATVAKRTENAMLSYQGTRRYGSDEAEPIDWIVPPFSDAKPGAAITSVGLSEMFAYHATTMANTVKSSLLVFSRRGNMPALLSHYRPDYPIYTFTEDLQVQRRLALYHGVTALYIKFQPDAESTFDMAIQELQARGFLKGGQLVAIVQSGRDPIWRSASQHAIQVRRVPAAPEPTSSQDEA